MRMGAMSSGCWVRWRRFGVGTTTMLEISNDIPSYADSLAATGMRLFLAENFNDVDDAQFAEGRYAFSPAKLEAGLRRSDDLITHWHGAEDGRVQCMVSPHAPELCSPELLRESCADGGAT